MAASWAQQFYGSTQWKKCRKGFLAYKRGLCERCLSKGLIVPGFHVHHKVYLTPENIYKPEISLNWANLELLCDKCHAEIHSTPGAKGRISINADGTVVGKEVDTR